MTAHLPPAEPPDPGVDEVLEELRRARGELTDARRVRHMVGLDDPGPDGFRRLRQLVEHRVAEHRIELWARAIAGLETRCRARGVDPDTVL